MTIFADDVQAKMDYYHGDITVLTKPFQLDSRKKVLAEPFNTP